MLGYYYKTYRAIVNGKSFDKRITQVIVDEDEAERSETLFLNWDDFFVEVHKCFNVSSYKIMFGKDIVMHSGCYFGDKIKKSEFKHAKIVTAYEKISPDCFSINDILKYNDSEKVIAYLRQEWDLQHLKT